MLPPLPETDLDEVLEHTRELWAPLSGERVFITGGTGFFGLWLLQSFAFINRRLGLGAQAVVLARRPEQFLEKHPHLQAHDSLSFWRGDASDFAFPAGRFAAVLHVATESYAAARDASDAARIHARDVAATARTLELASSADAARYLFTSSGAVYGRQPPELSHVPENFSGVLAPLDASTGYAHAKRASEALCMEHAGRGGPAIAIARCFAFAGPHLALDGNFAFGNFLRDALAGGPIRIAGDGTPMRSYMYMSDLMIWLWTLLFRGSSGRAYNVGSDRAVSIAELARTVADVVTPQVAIEIARPADPLVKPARYVPSIERARSELGLELRVALPQAIARHSAWVCASDGAFRHGFGARG